jgi:DNA-binding NtrC family response regulator
VFRRADHEPALEAVREILAADIPHGSRVLVVEDNQDIGEFAAQLLDDLGFQSILVSNATDGLAQIEQAPDAIDLVFSDVVMPGMNGVEFARIVHDRWPQIPVVLTSGYSHVLAEEAKHGFPLLQKPYSVDSLTRFIRNALAFA